MEDVPVGVARAVLILGQRFAQQRRAAVTEVAHLRDLVVHRAVAERRRGELTQLVRHFRPHRARRLTGFILVVVIQLRRSGR